MLLGLALNGPHVWGQSTDQSPQAREDLAIVSQKGSSGPNARLHSWFTYLKTLCALHLFRLPLQHQIHLLIYSANSY